EACSAERRIGGVELPRGAFELTREHGAVLRVEDLFLPTHPRWPFPVGWRDHRADDHRVRVAVVDAEVLLQQIRHGYRVIVKEHDQLAAGLLDTQVARGAGTLVGLAERA